MPAGHRVLTALGLGALALAAASPAALPARAQSSGITFSTPTVVSPVEAFGEPTIVHSPAADNTIYASGPWGSGTQRSVWYASADGGESFRLVNQCAPESGEVATECQPPTAVSGSANPPGGGDTDQKVDGSGKDYFVDLWALACDRVATTTDGGAHAVQNAYGCNSAPSQSHPARPDGSDRQWLAVYDPKLTGVTSTAPDAALGKVVYMEYNNLQTIQGPCSYWVKSTDGINFTPADNDNGNYGCDGYPSVDQVTGDVLEASGGQLNIGVPDASGNLTFLDDPGGNALGSHLIDYAQGTSTNDTLFAVSSMDTGRNLHITWADGNTRQVYTTVASAKTNWGTFAKPVQVSASPANTNVFAWVTAGGPGRSDSVWYGTDSTQDPSSNKGQEWYTYMAQAVWPVDSDGAVTLQPPAVQMVQVSPHPNHYNSICLAGTGCITSQGDRNLADFFSVTIDHTGAAEVEYDDTTNGLEQTGFTPSDGLADHKGAPVVTIARQDGGLGLYGTPVSPRPNEVTSAPTTGIPDGAGDALYPVVGGTNVAGLDLTGNSLALSPDGTTLTATMKVADLTANGISGAFSAVPGAAFLQYVTRWIMCPANSSTETNNCTISYAMAEIAPAAAGGSAQVSYSAGPAQSVDLCSVSACDPHAVTYPESPVGKSETGSLDCTATPCTLTVNVPVADVGKVTSSSLLEQVGAYSFASARPQAATANAQAEADQLPLEVDGACCFNFQATSLATAVPEAPTAPALVGAGLVLLGAGEVLRRRRRRRRAA